MGIRWLATFASLLIFVGIATISCDTGNDAVDTVRRISDDVATLVVPQPTAQIDPTPTQAQMNPDVVDVLGALERLEVAQRGSDIEYDRRDWRHWIDTDKDCQDTRAEVLILESLESVSFASDKGCRVTRGEWVGPWSGELFVDASDVDVDHHVPLGHAHISGGWRWDEDQKRAYANDLTNQNILQVTDASVNRSKGKKPPDEWRPDNQSGWCRYAADWISVKRQWNLTVTNLEVRALTDMLATCGDPRSWGLQGESSE